MYRRVEPSGNLRRDAEAIVSASAQTHAQRFPNLRSLGASLLRVCRKNTDMGSFSCLSLWFSLLVNSVGQFAASTHRPRRRFTLPRLFGLHCLRPVRWHSNPIPTGQSGGSCPRLPATYRTSERVALQTRSASRWASRWWLRTVPVLAASSLTKRLRAPRPMVTPSPTVQIPSRRIRACILSFPMTPPETFRR